MNQNISLYCFSSHKIGLRHPDVRKILLPRSGVQRQDRLHMPHPARRGCERVASGPRQGRTNTRTRSETASPRKCCFFCISEPCHFCTTNAPLLRSLSILNKFPGPQRLAYGTSTMFNLAPTKKPQRNPSEQNKVMNRNISQHSFGSLPPQSTFDAWVWNKDCLCDPRSTKKIVATTHILAGEGVST